MAGEKTPVNHFQRLGLTPAFELEPAQLEQRYLEFCRALHPDHTGSDPAAQQAATQATSRLNEAYQVLRDPARRADYLLMLHGGMAAEQDRSLPEGFLQLILEMREEIEAARERGDSAQAQSLLRQVDEQKEEFLCEVRRGFAEPPTAPGLRDLRRNLNALRYLERILE